MTRACSCEEEVSSILNIELQLQLSGFPFPRDEARISRLIEAVSAR